MPPALPGLPAVNQRIARVPPGNDNPLMTEVPGSPAAQRDLLAVVMTLTTGCADAVCFLHLGQAFASVITGNLVLLGLSAAKGLGSVAASSGIALGGYCAGVLAGAPIAREHEPRDPARLWPARVTACLAVELAVLAAFSVAWEVTGGRPAGVTRMLLLATMSVAMGMQSAAVRRLGQFSTTYMTSTLTGVLAGLVTAAKPDGLGRSLGVLAAIAAGAVAGAVTADAVPALLPLVLLAPLAAAIAGSLALARRQAEDRTSRP
jgi:uncharacterized membrane protein YoaK (UPF0700 family)